MERVMGIEPTSSAWKAEVLPLNYTRMNPAYLANNQPLQQRSHAGLKAFVLRFPAAPTGPGGICTQQPGPLPHPPEMVEGGGFEPPKA